MGSGEEVQEAESIGMMLVARVCAIPSILAGIAQQGAKNAQK